MGFSHNPVTVNQDDHSIDLRSYNHGIRLFNQQQFFDAHEVLEDVWRAAPAKEKKFLQGLIQLAVALHHHSRGNTVGALSLLKRAARNLAAEPRQSRGIRVAELLHSIEQCAGAIEQGRPLPLLPRLPEPEC
jgi:hypothetical protein